jgi:hypothetical protein
MPKNKVVMDKKDYIAEHKRLIKLLGDTSDALLEEKKTQESEPELKGTGYGKAGLSKEQSDRIIAKYKEYMEVPNSIVTKMNVLPSDWEYNIVPELPLDEQEFPTFGWSVYGFDRGSSKPINGILQWDFIDNRLFFKPDRRDAPGMPQEEKDANDWYQTIEVDFLDHQKVKPLGHDARYNPANAPAIVIDRLVTPDRTHAILYGGFNIEKLQGDVTYRPYYVSISRKVKPKAL